MTRPEFFVYLAFAVGWLLIAAWAFRIGGKANRLAARVEAASEAGRPTP